MPALDALKEQLIERTEGNPFFLEESVWHLAETGALTGARGDYRPARAVRDAQVPATVHAVLAARIDRLPALEKRLLQAAAVIGKDVPLSLLAAIGDLGEDRLRLALRQLQAAELLYEIPLFPAPEYTFKHALTYEVAAASVLRERRRALDGRIVETIEALGAEPRADQVERLAHHALRGEVWDKALTYCRQAGARAFARSAHRAAVEWFEHALTALAHLPETPDTAGTAIDLRLELRSSLSPLAEFSRMQDHLQEAERLAEAAGDRRRQGLVAAFLTNFHTVMLELRRAIEYGERAVAIAAQVSDVEAQVLAHTFLGLARYGQGDYRAAVQLARHNVALLRGDLVRERFGMAVLPAVYSRTVLVWSLAELGEFADGLAVGQENARIAEAAEHPYSIVFSRCGLGALHLRQGDLPRAVAELENGLALCRSADIRAPLLNVVTPLCSAYALAGRITDARRLVDEAVEMAVAMGDPLGHWLRTGVLAEIHLAAGRAEDALPLARRAVELTRYVKSRGAEAWAMRLLGEAEASQPVPLADDAQATYRHALARALELEMRPLQARCHLGLANPRAADRARPRGAGRDPDRPGHVPGARHALLVGSRGIGPGRETRGRLSPACCGAPPCVIASPAGNPSPLGSEGGPKSCQVAPAAARRSSSSRKRPCTGLPVRARRATTRSRRRARSTPRPHRPITRSSSSSGSGSRPRRKSSSSRSARPRREPRCP